MHMHAHQKMFIYIAWVAMVTVMGFSVTVFANGKEAPPGEISVPYKIMQMSDYQVFLKNWDETNNSVLYAMISTPAQYNDLFHPAPVMKSKRPFSPSETFYTRENILVVARVMPYPENVDKVFLMLIASRKGIQNCPFTIATMNGLLMQ